MNKIALVGAALLGGGILSLPVTTWAARSVGTNGNNIGEDTSNLLQAERQIQENKDKIAGIHHKLDTKILSQSQRSSLRDWAQEDKSKIMAYRDDMMADLGTLRAQWSNLTPTEREKVKGVLFDDPDNLR